MNRPLSLLALCLCAALAACGPRRHTPEGMADWVAAKIASRLDLNEVQKAKLKAGEQAYLDARSAHRADRAARMEELRQMILSDRLDAGKAKELIARRRREADDSFDALFNALADFHASLSTEQRQKAADAVEHFKSFDQK